jgi:hypothetical protein
MAIITPNRLLAPNGAPNGFLSPNRLLLPNYGVTGAVPWTPNVISTDGWWDASDNSTITEVGGIVTQIDDKSGNNVDLIANSATTNNHTLLNAALNGLDVVDLDGDDRYNGSSLLLSSGNVSFIMVCKVDVVDNALDSIFATVGASSFQYQSASTTNFLAQLSGPDSVTSSTSTDYKGAYRIFNALFDLSGSTQYSFVDGTQEGSSVYTTQLTASTSLRVFTNRGQSAYPEGQLAEALVVPDASVATRQKLEGYLAHKWGLTANLPGGHPYKTSQPTV